MEVVHSFLSRLMLMPPAKGQDVDHPLELLAVPGLMTILDCALYQSVEGQLTATTCSGHALLSAWLDLKHQAQLVLAELSSEESDRQIQAQSFSRLCLECASDAMERLTTDRLASSANLSEPYDNSTSGGSNHVLSGVGAQGIVSGVLESKDETGRRYPSEQRRKDLWETPRLVCVDFVWADDVFLTCQRQLRNLTKHVFYNDDVEAIVGASQKAPVSPCCKRYISVLIQLVKDDIPVRLHQFKAAMEADSAVSKRLYLVKCEYRAPFRAFLEAHQSVQRAPSIDMVDEYLASKSKTLEQKREQAQSKLQKLLETPALVEALSLERKCEEIEIELAQTLFPFTEMARIVEHKRAKLVAVPDIIDEDRVSELQELLRVSILSVFR